MIILHAGLIDDGLFLWGESLAADDASPGKRRARRPKVSHSQPFPYNAAFDGLRSALIEANVGFKPRKRDKQSIAAWLPTAAGRPIASSPLVADPPKSRAEPALEPWTVTGLRFSPEQAVEFLCACTDKQIIASGLVIGSDLAFWVTAMRFAGALLTRQQYLPGIREDHGEYRACWTPVVTGKDADRLAWLAKSMPAVCRALAKDSDTPPDTPASTVLTRFIGAIVDHLARTSVSEKPPGDPLKTGARRTRTVAHASIHDQWLAALKSPDGLMEGDASELAQFAAQLEEWQRPIRLSAAAQFRLCFRLEEPEDDKQARTKKKKTDTWNVRYLLQDTKDPSLLVPAEDAWHASGRTAAIFKRRSFNAHEYLLFALGQASGICPRIESSLKNEVSGGYELDAAGAHGFLTEKAIALEQAGFGVMLPAWWTRKGTKLRLSARANVKSPKMKGGSGMSLDELVNFNWEVALGGKKISYRELQELAKLKSPLVRLRGQWVEMSAEEIQAALRFWKDKKTGQATVRDIVQIALGAAKTPGSITFDGVTATGWINDLLVQLDGKSAFEELDTPHGFEGTLRPYQVRGYSWLAFLQRWGLGACLADDMGLGKTIQTLVLIQRDWHSEKQRPMLLICPTSVVGNWQKEAERFTPELPVMVHHGTSRAKGAAFKKEAEKHAIVISSYALLRRDVEILQEVSWSGVVLDEAQNIKNPEAKQAKAARSIAADCRIALTGTPVENNVGDLWSIMEFLNPGFLGTQADFKRSFFVPIQANQDEEAAERLKRITGPFILRRLKSDKSIIADLPEKLEMKVFCTLTKEQASLYQAVTSEVIQELKSAEGIQRKGIVLATLTKLKQVCNHPVQFLGDNSAIPGRSVKLARLTEMLEEVIEVGDRALVFSQFSEMGGILQRHLQDTFGREVFFLHGGVPKKKRDRMVERFQADEEGPSVFILSLKAGGTGLNLTAANHVFHFDRWWNPAVENQATDRAFRIGQTKNVQVHKFLCAGTLEERIDTMIERKKEVAERVVGTGEAWLTELSTKELKELFALSRDAVAE